MIYTQKKIILITGASGGIGSGILKKLIKKYYLIIIVRNQKKIKQVQFSVTQAKIYECDFNNPHNIKNVCQKIKLDFPQIDVLINNAAVFKTGDIKRLTAEDSKETFAVNVTAPFLLVKYLYSLLKKSAAPHVINIGSISSRHGWKYGSLYCASKSALTVLSESLREEFKKDKIRISVISPGQTDTSMSLLSKKDPLRKKLLKPDDIANTVSFIINQPENVFMPEIILRPLI